MRNAGKLIIAVTLCTMFVLVGNAEAQLSVKPCHLCNLSSTDPCVKICSDPLYRYAMGTVQEEKLNPGMDDFIESGFEASAGRAAPGGVRMGNTNCKADPTGVTQNCNTNAENQGDSGETNVQDIYFEPGSRESGLTVNPVTAGMVDASKSEAHDALYDSMLAKPSTIKRIAYRLTEPVVGAVLEEEMAFAADQVMLATASEANLMEKAKANPEAGAFAMAAYNDCVQAEVTRNAGSTSQNTGWFEASQKCLGGQRITELAGTTMATSSLNEFSGFSAQSSKNHKLGNPTAIPGAGALGLCTNENNDADCISALGYIFNQAIDDTQTNQATGATGGAGNNNAIVIATLEAARRLLGDVNIKFTSAGRGLSGPPPPSTGTAQPGGAGATAGMTSKVARIFKVRQLKPMFDGKEDAAGVLAGPDWYLKSITRQVYTSVFSILDYQCESYNEILDLNSGAGSAKDSAFPANAHPYDMYGWYNDADMWKRSDIVLGNNGEVVCTGSPWASCSAGGTTVSINRLLLDASAPGMGFNKAIGDAIFHYFLIHENYVTWGGASTGGCGGGTCSGPPSSSPPLTSGGIRELDCRKLRPDGDWGIDKVMDGNIIRKDMPKIVRVVFTYALRVGTQKLWEMFDQLERVIGSITGGTHTSLAKEYVVQLLDAQAGVATAKGKMANHELYTRFIEGLFQDRHNHIGSGDLFQTVMQAGSSSQGGSAPGL